MAIAVKTYLTLSGLNNLAKEMFKQEEVYWIPKEKWRYINGRYKKQVIIDPRISEGLKLWKGEAITDVYSMETCMIDYGWIDSFKRKGVKVHDIPMIEWVERKKFNSKKYEIFDSIICLNDYCYSLFSSKYSSAKRKNVNFLLRKNNFGKKDNLIYHQSSVHCEDNYKNTKNCIKAFLRANTNKYKMIVTGKISQECKRLCKKSGGKVEYLGIIPADKVRDIYIRSKYLLAPSLQEGLGMSLYESKKYGCKVITTNFSPMKEVGDYLCKTKVIEDCGKFMYPKLIVDENSIFSALDALLI